VSTIWGDLLWCDGGWPGSCHDHELVNLSGLGEVLDTSGVAGLLDRGFRGMPSRASTGMRRVGDRRTKDRLSDGSGRSTASRLAYARWWSSRSAILLTPGRCAAGGACCAGSGTSSGPLAR
jgi:hypothetical protein